jgi:hypothetical protein
VKYISARLSKPQTLLHALGAAPAYVWLSDTDASVRAAPVLPMLVGPYRRLLALRGARIRPDQAPIAYSVLDTMNRIVIITDSIQMLNMRNR